MIDREQLLIGVLPCRRYRPRAERLPSPIKAAIAAARPRDARGRFLPVVAVTGADSVALEASEAI